MGSQILWQLETTDMFHAIGNAELNDPMLQAGGRECVGITYKEAKV